MPHVVLRYIYRKRNNLDKTGIFLIHLVNPICSRRACYFKNWQRMAAIVQNDIKFRKFIFFNQTQEKEKLDIGHKHILYLSI